jgi:hypothetical protein
MYPTPTAGCEEGGEQSDRVEQTKSGGFVLRKKNKPNMTFGAKLSDAMLYLEKQTLPNSNSKGLQGCSSTDSRNGKESGDKSLPGAVQCQTMFMVGSSIRNFVEILNGISARIGQR